MINSIQQFCGKGVKNLEKIMVNYSEDMTKIAEMVQGVTKSVVELGLSVIAEEWESYDELLRKNKEMRPSWYIVRRDKTTLLTSLGSITYHKTLFKNKVTGVQYAFPKTCLYNLNKQVFDCIIVLAIVSIEGVDRYD